MRKIALLTIMFAFFTSNIYSSEMKGKGYSGFYFSDVYNNYHFNLSDKQKTRKFAFDISNTDDKLLLAAILFTAFDGLNLALGITGAILYGVSTAVLFTSSDTTGVLLYGGIALMAWGFTWFALLLAGVIVFWVFYLYNTKSAMKNMSVSDKDIALCIRL